MLPSDEVNECMMRRLRKRKDSDAVKRLASLLLGMIISAVLSAHAQNAPFAPVENQDQATIQTNRRTKATMGKQTTAPSRRKTQVPVTARET